MNIIVTGCSSGIGYQTVLELAKLGKHHIIAISRSSLGLNDLKQVLLNLNSESQLDIISFDLSEENYDYLIEKVNSLFTEPIDILINNAGYLVNKSFLETSVDEWNDTLKLNLLAPARLIKAFYPTIRKNGNAHIVNIGSMGGVQGSAKFSGLAAYSTSKGALNILTESLAVEFEKDGIRVNAINPGAVQTKMLEEAFPGFQAEISPNQMGKFIASFAINNKEVMSGRLVQASLRS